ncbi:MAG: glycosyltransferase family 2 protein [Armatimonadota bacterium]
MRQASLLIPAFNEEDRIAATVRAACRLQGVSEVIVIDDGSTDGTAAAAAEAGASRVLRLPRNRGKGAALDAGLCEAREPVILMLDGDLGESASLAQPLLDPVLADEADMTVAVFPELVSRQGGGGLGLALRLARWGIRVLTGAQLAAPLSGQRALDRRIVETMGGFGRGFGVETALSGWAAAGGWRVIEVPLAMSHRRTGRDLRGFLHRGRQLLHIARALIWLIFSRRRARSSRS